MKTNLASCHPIADLKENLVFASNGNLVLCYRLKLPETFSLSERDYEEIHGIWFQGLRNLPAGCVLHKQDIYRKREFSGKKLFRRTFLGQATWQYFRGRPYLDHESLLFFIWTGNKGLNHSRFINPFRKISKSRPSELEAGLEVFTESVRDAVSYINNSKKIIVAPLGEKEILEVTQAYFNGFNEACDTDILLQGPGLQGGKNSFEVLAVNNEMCFGEAVQTSKPDRIFNADDFVFHTGFLDGLGLGIKEDHILNQVIYFDDKSRWRKLLERRSDELRKSSNFGNQNKLVLEKITGILDRISKDENSRVIRGHLNVVLWNEDPQKLSATCSKVKTEFRELDIMPYFPIGEERRNYFINSYFCFSSNLSEEDLYVTDLKHALCLLINNSSYRSDETGVIFNDRIFNIPVLKDVWDDAKKRIKARNFAIFAPTGEGKSFLANNILRQYYESGVRLVIIDLGGSYSKFAKLYPEDHLILRYEEGKNLGINPFFITGKGDITPQHLEDLSTFLLELFTAGTMVVKAEEVALKKILRHFYRKFPSCHSMQSFYDFVSSTGDQLLPRLQIHPEYFDLANFLHIMSEYVGEGLYSFLFEIREDQSFKLEQKRLIIFELDQIRNNKEILAVMLKLIKAAIQRTIWQNRSEKGIILFDEFAKQLKFDHVLESVEFYYQAIRKQNGAIGIILQSINQLPQNATSASILENTQVIYSLNNEKGYDELRKRLNLSSHELNQLRSIRNRLTGTGKYTEIFIKIGRESNVFRLEVPPEAEVAYLTDGSENAALMEIFEKTGCMETAINQFINQNNRR